MARKPGSWEAKSTEHGAKSKKAKSANQNLIPSRKHKRRRSHAEPAKAQRKDG
jgi:hypothetical protein